MSWEIFRYKLIIYFYSMHRKLVPFVPFLNSLIPFLCDETTSAVNVTTFIPKSYKSKFIFVLPVNLLAACPCSRNAHLKMHNLFVQRCHTVYIHFMAFSTLATVGNEIKHAWMPCCSMSGKKNTLTHGSVALYVKIIKCENLKDPLR